ncbi:hypothetical protein ME763_37135 (plasmid) [Streptomyces murinus]|nr:hypothetical protein [Streptomyces murinus]WDO11350.1 hypothetical protein ME763_37135 [Streptomyces murinus]
MDLSGGQEPGDHARRDGAVREDRGRARGAAPAQLGGGGQAGVLGGVADAARPVDVHVADAECQQFGAGLFDALPVEGVDDPHPYADVAAQDLDDVGAGRGV